MSAAQFLHQTKAVTLLPLDDYTFEVCSYIFIEGQGSGDTNHSTGRSGFNSLKPCDIILQGLLPIRALLQEHIGVSAKIWHAP